ncbi:MAG: short-chain dehydrogenase/reductase SDR [Hyphomonadaceae bacterium]|nr:MAG: short-chain dehydrogenase/reductase SDR [Hyphomonadaceae bacterium]KAF0185401.1 MAG: short-chain dehydrogenase/reductase SDR [Hyphomonadaceae bacterium]
MSDKPVVLVTGASQGIGRAAAHIMARAGWHVIATARSEKALISLDDEILAISSESATIVPLDLKDGPGVDRLGGAIYSRFGKLDGLIHCAARIGDLGPLHHATPREAQNIIDTNLTATYRLIASMNDLLAAAPNARAVFLSSSVAREPRANWGLYAATKAGLEAMVLCWAAEQSLNNIVATIFNPGGVATPMRRKAYPGEDQTTLPAPSDLSSCVLELMSPKRTKAQNGAIVNFRDTKHYEALKLRQ